MVIYKWEKQAKAKYKSYGDDGSNGRNRRREVRMYIALYTSGSSAKAINTASTVIATGNLRQGRMMADHGGLYTVVRLLIGYGRYNRG